MLVPRDAVEEPDFGTFAVSPITMEISSAAQPNSSMTICSIAARIPCPHSSNPNDAVILPSLERDKRPPAASIRPYPSPPPCIVIAAPVPLCRYPQFRLVLVRMGDLDMAFNTCAAPSVGAIRCSSGPKSCGFLIFFLLSSSGSMPSMPLRRSRWVSSANVIWLPPKPRNSPATPLFVNTDIPSVRIFGIRYGPAACSTEKSRTAGPSVAYAPVSATIFTSCANRFPE
ncbi:hypothetical protein BSMD_038980 [Bacillus subtilis Miyagi-4]|nr:hypothetical protein BSMD_038980 [Bacillus subtilis Miyagi-4]